MWIGLIFEQQVSHLPKKIFIQLMNENERTFWIYHIKKNHTNPKRCIFTELQTVLERRMQITFVMSGIQEQQSLNCFFLILLFRHKSTLTCSCFFCWLKMKMARLFEKKMLSRQKMVILANQISFIWKWAERIFHEYNNDFSCFILVLLNNQMLRHFLCSDATQWAA